MKEETTGNCTPPVSDQEVPNPFAKFNHTYLIQTCFRRCPHLIVSILGKKVEGLLDTGASVSIVSSLSLVNQLGLKIQKCDLKIFTADRTPYTCQGYVNVPFKYQEELKIIPTLVVPRLQKI